MKSCRKSLSEVFIKKVIYKFFEYSQKNIHYGERLSKGAPATLLKSLSVISHFLEIFRKFKKNGLHYKKHRP